MNTPAPIDTHSSHPEIIHKIREYYNPGNIPSSNKGYEILYQQDELLHWLLSVLYNKPVPAPGPDLPWNELISSLKGHRIEAFLSYRLHDLPVMYHPPDPWKKVLDSSQIQGISWFRTIVQISHLNQVFKEAGIPYALLKGPALAWQVYPHPSLRDGIDIDILINENDINAASTCLCKNGYSIRFESSKVSEHVFHHQVFFPESGRGTKPIEIHWRPLFLPKATGDVNGSDLFNRLTYINTEIGDVPVLSLADSLMYAATHMCIGHPDELRLIWILDIDLISSRITHLKKWKEVEDIALKWQGIESLKRSLTMASLWMRTKNNAFSTGWPEPSFDEMQIVSHADKKKNGNSLNLHEQIREMPNFHEKIKVLMYCCSASSKIQTEHTNQSWGRKIRAYKNILKTLYNSDEQSIHDIMVLWLSWCTSLIRVIRGKNLK